MKAPKSAYSAATKTGKVEKHIMVVWVDNEAGVLARVVGLFSGRGYNIESLAVAEIDKSKNFQELLLLHLAHLKLYRKLKNSLKSLCPCTKLLIL